MFSAIIFSLSRVDQVLNVGRLKTAKAMFTVTQPATAA